MYPEELFEDFWRIDTEEFVNHLEEIYESQR